MEDRAVANHPAPSFGICARGELDRARAALLAQRNRIRERDIDPDIAADIYNVLAEIEFADGHDAKAVEYGEMALSHYGAAAAGTVACWSARTNLCLLFSSLR